MKWRAKKYKTKTIWRCPPMGNVTIPFKESFVDKEKNIDEMVDVQRYAYLQSYKEEDKMEKEMWSLYHVVVVDKEERSKITPNIDKKVIAKNEDQAKGIAGVADLIANKEYDNTKLAIKVIRIMDIRPIEDDE